MQNKGAEIIFLIGGIDLMAIYRKTSIGQTLETSLDELKEQIPKDLKDDILDQFDKSMYEALNNLVETRVSLKVFLKISNPKGSLSSLRQVNGVYMIVGNKVEINVSNYSEETVKLENIKFVAVEEKK